MKRRIVWKRLLILAGGVFGVCLLGIVALFTVGRPLLSKFRASMWKTDPVLAQEAARAMLDYQLPAGYTETKLLRVQNAAAAVIITNPQHPGDILLLQSLPDGIREEEAWRKRYEERWSNDLDGHRYRVRTVEIRTLQIDGAAIPVRLLEGTDEQGKPVKQAACILPGKTGEVLVAVMGRSGSWDFNLVEEFYRSIQ
jgi:hypothetical protein